MAKFELRYSPLFYDDLNNITDYILLDLKNELAAIVLVNDLEAAIKMRLINPLQTTPYKSINHRKHIYRRILVGNYLIFYIVEDNTMIVRRLLYGRRDLERIL